MELTRFLKVKLYMTQEHLCEDTSFGFSAQPAYEADCALTLNAACSSDHTIKCKTIFHASEAWTEAADASQSCRIHTRVQGYVRGGAYDVDRDKRPLESLSNA